MYKSEPFRTEVAISRMYRVCQEFSGFIGTARLCPHSFSPPGLIAPLKLRHEELVHSTPPYPLLHLLHRQPPRPAPTTTHP
ncbi:hypothetical protein J6590_098647 [Homalodisca vitripennis]|nr:hypothetical protein J6590_098647 [Homalodisca vitripennis]